MLQDFLIPLIAIGLSELGDKTQFAIMSLAAKTHRHFEILVGAMLAFALADGAAILLGASFGQLIPIPYLRLFAGIAFIVFGIISLRNHTEKEQQISLKRPFLSTFLLVLVSEIGDKSQIAAGLFATTYSPWFVFMGVLGALAILSILAIIVGKVLLHHVHKRWLRLATGTLFILIGALTLVQINKF